MLATALFFRSYKGKADLQFLKGLYKLILIGKTGMKFCRCPGSLSLSFQERKEDHC